MYFQDEPIKPEGDEETPVETPEVETPGEEPQV